MTAHFTRLRAVHPFAQELCGVYIPCTWTPEHVEKRLVDAIRVSITLTGWRPNTFSNSWPKYRNEWADLIAQVGSADDPEVIRAARDARPARARPSSVEIELMEEASSWVGAYIGDRPTLALSLQIWLLGSAFGLKRGSLALKRGIEPGHVKQHAQHGLDIIVSSLCADQILVR